MTHALPERAVAERLADRIAALEPGRLPAAVRTRCEELVIDVVGLCIAARRTDYVAAALAGWDEDGRCTALGHDRRLSAAGAALVNGIAAHGEDFDDTFEGGPVHAGAVIVPAVLAASERHGCHGDAALLGIAVGVETMCRLSLVVPKAVHRAGFHPTAVFGAMASAAAVSAALSLERRGIVDALGIAGSMAGGIIEYLAEGTWTKRLHPGWAAQSGLRAAGFAASGFIGPRTVFEGTHGLFNGFARQADGDYGALVEDFGLRWVTETIAFKPYACGTMTHPYIDCARRLARRGIAIDDIVEIVCEVAEGTVHRLWEPLAAKRRPHNGYAAKFSTPYCIAAGFILDGAGLEAFSDETVRDPRLLALATKVRYEIDPKNPYPNAYTGHLRVRLKDGSTIEERQPHLRGGVSEPLSRAAIVEKFARNARHGGWPQAKLDEVLEAIGRLFDRRVDLAAFRG